MRDEKLPAVYIMADRYRGTLYVGVTSNLWSRVWDHKNGTTPGFTSKYGLKTLVWYEHHGSMDAAIRREKQMKAWKRDWKIRLVEKLNPDWSDLHDAIDPVATLVEPEAGPQHPLGDDLTIFPVMPAKAGIPLSQPLLSTLEAGPSIRWGDDSTIFSVLPGQAGIPLSQPLLSALEAGPSIRGGDDSIIFSVMPAQAGIPLSQPTWPDSFGRVFLLDNIPSLFHCE